MKFACLIEIPAFPIEYPLRPNESIILPAASPSGFLKIEPELGIVRGWVCDRLDRWRSMVATISERSPSFNSISASININDMDDEAKKYPIVTKVEKDITLNSIMSNSFGFGGTNATLVFEKI